jgi:hypothetical protein
VLALLEDVVPDVHLEQQVVPTLRRDPGVHLEQPGLTRGTLELVLVAAQVADVGARLT